jgi:hypothetical protein
MTGIQFITDEAGQKTALVIDLKKHKALWETSRTWSSPARGATKNASR